MQLPVDILGGQGALSRLLPGFAPRSQQIAMAEAIDDCIADHRSLICEAGTGTGKTFAYLTPAILSGKKIIISTGTRHLQDQLYFRDLPLILQATGNPVNAALLKGRANYLCLLRMHQVEKEHRYLQEQTRDWLTDIRGWSQQTDAGDLSELAHIPEDAAVRPLVTSNTDNCLGQECEHFSDCFVFKARKRAAEADLAVVNHHLFLADMALKETGYGDLLPQADIVIFDEAHQLPDLASQFFSLTLSSRQITELITDSKTAYLGEAADLPDFLLHLDNLDKAARDLRLSFKLNENRRAWHDVCREPAVVSALTGLMESAYTVHQALEEFANRGKLLDNCFHRLDTMLAMLDSFSENTRQDLILWLELRGNGFLLHQTPLDVADTFQQRLADYDCLTVYTSATLTVNNHFRHFASQLGLDEVTACAWDSPFNYRDQTLLYLPQGLPDPRTGGYTEMVVAAALPVLQTTRGRAFFLFTSHRALRLAADVIRESLDYTILVQGDAPKTELLDTFRNTAHAVLLGTSSFWEGVDVKGQALSCVIIDKLPFAAPDDPVLSARMKKLEEQDRNPFFEYQVPEAVITLKQGIGRLIRDAQDYGVLMICDPRLLGKSYGKIFLKSLPDIPITHDPGDVTVFFNRHEG